MCYLYGLCFHCYWRKSTEWNVSVNTFKQLKINVGSVYMDNMCCLILWHFKRWLIYQDGAGVIVFDEIIRMSRWGRGRNGSVAVPLDTALFRENSNCPSAARSAGTVGKWGTTSFTSIRSAPYGKYHSLVHSCLALRNNM